MNAAPLQALIFDVDGTLADTESAHRAAFNHAFSELGMDWHWDESLYTELLGISGGKERIRHYWESEHLNAKVLDGQAMQETINHIHQLKTTAYEQAVLDGAVALRPGVLELIEDAFANGLRLAIATTTSHVNVKALLRKVLGVDWQQYFSVVEDASTAPVKKPDPQVYLQTLQRLRLPAQACLAFEDSANGLRAAGAAGLETIITPTIFTAHHDFVEALRVRPSLCNVSVADINAWRINASAAPTSGLT